MTPLRTTFSLLLVASVVMVAGCMGGDYIREQDIIVVKSDDSGNVLWIKTIDTGKDDVVTDILQDSKGNFILSGGYSSPGCNNAHHYLAVPLLTWMSYSGDIINQKTYSTDTPDGFIALFNSPEGSYYIISQNGILRKIDQSGSVQWNQSVGVFPVENYFVIPDGGFDIFTQTGIFWRINSDGAIVWNRTINVGIVHSTIKTADNDYIVIGQRSETVPLTRIRERDKYGNITWRELGENSSSQGYASVHQIENATAAKINPDGNVVWERSFGKQGFVNFNSIQELGDNQGYLVEAETEFDPNVYPYYGGDQYSLSLDKNGNIINSSLYRLRENFIPVKSSSEVIVKNTDGSTVTVNSIDESRFNRYDFWRQFQVVKTDSDGSIVWIKNITSFKRTMGFGEAKIKKIIPTADGGYVMVFENENVCSCSGCNVKRY